MINKNYMIIWGVVLWIAVVGGSIYRKYFSDYDWQNISSTDISYQQWNQKNQSNSAGAAEKEYMINNMSQTTLTDDIKQWLLTMREEEKLAKDVYKYFAWLYSVQAFTNITSSETKHMSSVKVLLDKYNIDDPVKDDTIWVFTNPTFTNLYNELTTKGANSLREALKIWIQIEEMDIADIDKLLLQVWSWLCK